MAIDYEARATELQEALEGSAAFIFIMLNAMIAEFHKQDMGLSPDEINEKVIDTVAAALPISQASASRFGPEIVEIAVRTLMKRVSEAGDGAIAADTAIEKAIASVRG